MSAISTAPGFALPRTKRVGALSSGRERPVFFDETGRRARLVAASGKLVGAVTATWFVAIVVGASGPVGLPSLQSQLAAAHRGGGAGAVARIAVNVATPQRPSGRDIEARIDRRA